MTVEKTTWTLKHDDGETTTVVADECEHWSGHYRFYDAIGNVNPRLHGHLVAEIRDNNVREVRATRPPAEPVDESLFWSVGAVVFGIGVLTLLAFAIFWAGPGG